ncbi:MAG: S1 family peptidase [Actinomycetota bacterium]
MHSDRDNLFDVLLPKTVVGLTVWILMFALGAGVSGVIFFALYQRRVNSIEERFIRFEERMGKELDARVKELEAEMKKTQGAPVGRPLPTSRAAADDPETVAATVEGSIAQIEGRDEKDTPTLGSGFVVRSTPGESWIITNYHLVAKAADENQPVRVTVGAARQDSEVYAADKSRDLALVIFKLGGLPALSRSKANLEVGATAWAVGTSGRPAGASAIKVRLAEVSPLGIGTDSDFAPNLSGGPLLDPEGKVIGVLSVTYAPPGLQAAPRWVVPLPLACHRVLRCPTG